jgi:regulator of sirC expression with transglutaminase-like and TPR domain
VPRSSPFGHSPQFERLVGGDAFADLTRIALEIAADAYPGLDIPAYLARIDALAERVRQRCPDGAPVGHILGQINWVLYDEEDFRGNSENYYDPRNSYLNEVLDRRLGIPISLSVLYLAVAGRIGLAMDGVNTPAHFMVRVARPGEEIFVDPYHGGVRLDRRGCARRVSQVTGEPVRLAAMKLGPCPPSEIVARMLRNLKAIYLKDGAFASSLPVLRRLVALLRSEPLERRDLGVACIHAGRPGEAIDHLAAYLAARPSADDAGTVASLLRTARRAVASWN